MKKIVYLLTASLALAAGYQAEAQTDVVTLGNRVYETNKFRFGAYLAPTSAWMKPSADKSKDGQHRTTAEGGGAGFTYGLMAEYWFADNYGLISGFQMNMARGSIGTSYVGAATEGYVQNSMIDYKLNYLEIPLNLKMKTDPIENFTFFGQAGFTLGINVSRKYNYDLNYIDNAGTAVRLHNGEDFDKIRGALGISPVLLTMNIGLGAEYPINNKLAGYFGVFYNNGFTPDATFPSKYNINDQDIPDFQDGTVRVNNFAFRIGLFF